MSKVLNKAEKVKEEIAAIKTLVYDYPALTEMAALLNADNISMTMSINFIALLLWLIGISKEDMINWFAGLLSDKDSNGFLNGLEYAIKGILTANVKGLFTCSMNPFLTDEIINDGIELDVRTLDPFHVLSHCPLSKEGSCYYFDTVDSIYNKKNEKGNGYSINDIWKSCDFNAYLWYIMNRATKNEQDIRNYWDNRNKKSTFNVLKTDKTLREKFFDPTNTENKNLVSNNYTSSATGPIVGVNKSQCGTIDITDGPSDEAKKVNKKLILYTQFEERLSRSNSPAPPRIGSNVGTNVLVVRPARQRYYHTWEVDFKYGDFIQYNAAFNRTAFEFNYDYIWSLKLFDSKTLVTNIINSIMGLSTVQVGLSIEDRTIEAEIGAIVREIIRSEDTTVDDCYYKFSNLDYDRLMKKAEQLQKGESSKDLDELYEKLSSISTAPTLNEQKSIISGVLMEYAGTTGKNGSVSNGDINFNADYADMKGGLNLIYQLFENTITQIVMQMLSPKVILLYMVNMKLMGNIDPETAVDDIKNFDIKQIMGCMMNVLATTIQELKDIFVSALFKWLMQQLKPLIALFASRIVLETVKDYTNVIMQLIQECSLGFLDFGEGNIYAIDNVKYADIIPKSTKPKTDNC